LAILQERAALVMDDFFEFIIGEPASELDAAPYGGGRFPVETVLDGRTFAKFHLDIGAGDLQREPPEFVRPRDCSLSPEFPRRSSHPSAARNTLRKNSMLTRCQESGRTRVLRTLWTWCCLSMVVA
jgi:hypothetical protein